LAFYPKFGVSPQQIVILGPSNGISGVTIDPAGAGLSYQVGDQVQIVQPGASESIIAVETVGPEGQVLTVSIIEGGFGFSIADGLPTTGGSGNGLILNITAIAVLGGEDYVVGDIVNILQQGATGGTATVTAVDSNGAVQVLAVQYGGQGYSVASGLLTTGGTGAGLQVSVTQITPYSGVIPQPVLQTFITLASACLSQPRWLDMWMFGMHLFVAHYCTLYLQSEGNPGTTAGQVAQSGLQTGVTIAKSAGDVSVSKQQIVERHLEQFGSWLLTQYGQQLAQMASSVGSGMMLIY
jgi:uncharacterized protein DUF4054